MRSLIFLGCALAALAGVHSIDVLDPRDPVTTCSWFAYDPNVAIAGYCQLSNLYMLAIKPEPTTYIAKALTRVFGRQYECNQLEEKYCKASYAAQLGCLWGPTADKSRPGSSCNSKEYLEWRYFTTHPYTFGAPKWMSCPKGVPNCPAACYLKQVTSIEKTATMSKADAEKACKANPYAKWVDGSCSPNLFGSDAWGKEVNRLSAACAPKEKAVCLGKSATDAKISIPRYFKLKAYPSKEEAKPVKCPV